MENKLADKIQNITVEAKEMFLKTSDRLFLERVEKEHKLAKQYYGREILELLQNIDDAYDPKCNQTCEACFELTDDCFIVSNYGKPFTKETLQRLCQGSVSSKEGKYIGSKGIGFRSILNWSNKVEIYSGESDYIAVRFSSDYANKMFEAIKEDDHIKTQMEELKRKKITPSFPIFKAPEPIEPIEKTYDTVIRIYIEDEIKGKIRESIKNFDKYSLLFLPNVQKISFKDNSETTTYTKERCTETTDEVTIKCNNDDGESFYFFENDQETICENINGTNSIRMAVAIPTETTDNEYNLYTFFPILNIKSPFNALLHATFSLNANRNNFESSIEDDKINKAVFLKLLEFYVSKVENLDLEERRLQLLTPNNFGKNFSFPDDLARLKCVREYIDLIKNKNIFFSINREYLNAEGGENAPVLINDIPERIKQSKSDFSRLVVIRNEEKLFAEQLVGTNNQVESYLCEAINRCSNSWTPDERISVFKWWNAKGYTGLPYLIKDSKGNFIVSSENPCFLSGSITDIPEWANINIVQENDEKALLRLYNEEITSYRADFNSNENEKRILPRLIKSSLINLQEQSSKQVMISPVNKSVSDNFSNAKEYIQWLWKVWEHEEKFDATIKSNVKFVVPTAKETVKNAEETYIGNAFYGNELGEKLFSQLDFEKVYTPDFIDEDEKEKFVRFLFDIGVSKYPKITRTKIERVDNYIEHIKANHTFECEHYINQWNASVMYNTDIDSILKNADTETILKWILADNQLKTQIVLDEEPEASYVEYLPRVRGQKYFERWNRGWNLPSYIRYVFSTTEWLQVDNGKYKPSQLMISSDFNMENIVCISEDYIEKLASELDTNYEDLKQILLKLGVKESYLDLESNQFYRLLLQLGEKNDDRSKKISREIYRAVINNNRGSKAIRTSFYLDSEEKSKFLKYGKVLAKKLKEEAEYKPINEVSFSSSAVLNLGDRYFIDIPPRSGNKDNFKGIFGIEPYEQEYSIEKEPIKSQYNREFQDDFKNYLPYLLTYRSGNKTTVSLDIQLVSEINITIDGSSQNVETPYSLLKETKSKWYIYVKEDEVLSYDKIDKCKVAEALEQIFNVYFNFPAKDFLSQVVRLFICTPAQRKYLVESDFGSSYEYNSTLDDLNKAEEIKQKIKKDIVGCSPNSDKLNSLVCEIDWMDLDNPSVQKKIVSLLKAAEKSIDDLNKILSRTVSIVAYNRNKLLAEYNSQKEQIKLDIYYHCKTQGKYAGLIELWDNFESEIKKVSSNDLDFDEKTQLKQIKQKFYDNKSIKSCSGKSLSIKDVYSKNKEELKKTFQEDNLNLNDFINDNKNHSLLYFDKNVWEDKVKAFIESCKKEDEQEAQEEDNMSETVDNILQNIKIENDLDPGKPRVPSGSRHNSGAVTERNTSKKNKESKRQGNRAEYIVILALAQKKISEVNTFFDNEDYSIIWKSGAANEISKAKDDQNEYDTSQVDDGAGYDIELVGKKDPNNKMFIEVKSSSSNDCSFFMSINEYNKAKEIERNGETYRIVFVSNIDSEETKISFIDGSVKDVFEAIPTQFNIIYKKKIVKK